MDNRRPQPQFWRQTLTASLTPESFPSGSPCDFLPRGRSPLVKRLDDRQPSNLRRAWIVIPSQAHRVFSDNQHRSSNHGWINLTPEPGSNCQITGSGEQFRAVSVSGGAPDPEKPQ
jgi:hypothetical protein